MRKSRRTNESRGASTLAGGARPRGPPTLIIYISMWFIYISMWFIHVLVYLRGLYTYLCGLYTYLCGLYTYLCGLYTYLCGLYTYICDLLLLTRQINPILFVTQFMSFHSPLLPTNSTQCSSFWLLGSPADQLLNVRSEPSSQRKGSSVEQPV